MPALPAALHSKGIDRQESLSYELKVATACERAERRAECHRRQPDSGVEASELRLAVRAEVLEWEN